MVCNGNPYFLMDDLGVALSALFFGNTRNWYPTCLGYEYSPGRFFSRGFASLMFPNGTLIVIYRGKIRKKNTKKKQKTKPY